MHSKNCGDFLMIALLTILIVLCTHWNTYYCVPLFHYGVLPAHNLSSTSVYYCVVYHQSTSVLNCVLIVHFCVLPDSLITSISWFRQDPVPVKNIVMTVESKKLRKRRLALGQIVLELQVEGNISLFPKYFICRLPL